MPLAPIALALLLAAPAQGFDFTGRGVRYFEGEVECPLAGVGLRGSNDGNRIALDDAFSTVTVDPAAHRIVLTNAHLYPDKTMIGDLMFLARGTDAAGHPVEAAVHLEVQKKGGVFSWEFHPHEPDVALASAEVDDYEVVLSDGVTQTKAMDHADAIGCMVHPDSSFWVDERFLQLKDGRRDPSEDPSKPGYTLADVTKSLGFKILSKKLLNVRIVSMDGSNAAAIAGGDLRAMLAKGSWQLRITSLSSWFPQEHLKRDMFVLGLASGPVVDEIGAHGLPKGVPLVFEIEDGKGRIEMGSLTQEVPDVLDCARNFLEFNFFGAQVAWRVRHPQGDGNSAATPDRTKPAQP